MNGTPKAANTKTVLVTGATGYIGGRLVPRLLEAGHRVKVLVRTPAKIAGVPWLEQVEVIQSSLDDGAALREALEGVDVLYYLVHSMAGGSGFRSQGKAMAETAAQAAAGAASSGLSTSAACTPPGPSSPRTCGPGRPWARSSWTARSMRSCSRRAS